MASENLYEKIEAYLDGSLSAIERKAFERAMKNDKELREEVKLHKDLSRLLANSPEKAFRSNLETLGNRLTVPSEVKKTSGYLKYLLPLLFVAMAALWWFSQKSNNNAPTPQENIESPKKPIMPDNLKEATPNLDGLSPAEKEEIKKEAEQPIKEVTLPKQTSKPPIYADDTPSSGSLIAAADFAPNQSLEFLIENRMRSNEVDFSIKNKQNNTRLKAKDDATNFEMTGTFTSELNMLKKDIKLHLFSNKKLDYQKFLPVVSTNCPLDKTSKTEYVINCQKSIVLKPGLYYYLLEDTETEEIFYVDKFEVK